MSMSMPTKPRPTHRRQPSLIPAPTDAFLRLIAASPHVPYTSLPNISLAQPIVLLQSPPQAPPADQVPRFTLSYRGVWSAGADEAKYRTFAVDDNFMGKTVTVYVWAGPTPDEDFDMLSPTNSPMKSNGSGRTSGTLKRSGSYSSSSTLSSGGSTRDFNGSGLGKRMMVGASERYTMDNERFRVLLVDTLAGAMATGKPTAWINNIQ